MLGWSLRKEGPYLELFWATFSLIGTEYGEIRSLRINYECGKIPTRITLNTDTFHAVDINQRNDIDLLLNMLFNNYDDKIRYVNPLLHSFSTPWKHQKSLKFSDVFERQRKGALEANGLSWHLYFCL